MKVFLEEKGYREVWRGGGRRRAQERWCESVEVVGITPGQYHSCPHTFLSRMLLFIILKNVLGNLCKLKVMVVHPCISYYSRFWTSLSPTHLCSTANISQIFQHQYSQRTEQSNQSSTTPSSVQILAHSNRCSSTHTSPQARPSASIFQSQILQHSRYTPDCPNGSNGTVYRQCRRWGIHHSLRVSLSHGRVYGAFCRYICLVERRLEQSADIYSL